MNECLIRIYPILNIAGGMYYRYSCWSDHDQEMVDSEGTSFLYSRIEIIPYFGAGSQVDASRIAISDWSLGAYPS